MYSHRVPPNAVVLRQNLHRRNYQFTKTGDATWLLTLMMPHLALAVFAHPLALLLSGFLVEHTFCNIRNHPSMFFFFTMPCGGAAMGSSSNELPSERRWVYPWENAHHTRKCAHNHTEHTHVQKEFLPASALKKPCQSCLCVTKSHSQRAFYPPRLRGPWHWQRTHTQRHVHKHNLHAWCNVQSLEQTDTFGDMKQHCSESALISETILLHFYSSSSWVVYSIQ